MANGVYTSFKTGLMQAGFNLGSDTIKIMLVNGYAFNAAHAHRSDITNETTGTGYSAGGAALSGLSVAASGTSAKFTATNPSWASSTISATGAVIYKSNGSAATDTLICYLDFGGTITDTNGTFTVTFDSTNGINLLS
ncbi:MAG: hypothetical protein KGJ86_00255 [Chloroflexota bacterium]|nr:hypothetical protein [Chloroflexota bacterium]